MLNLDLYTVRAGSSQSALGKGFEGLQKLLRVIVECLLHKVLGIFAAESVAHTQPGGCLVDRFKDDLALAC